MERTGASPVRACQATRIVGSSVVAHIRLPGRHGQVREPALIGEDGDRRRAFRARARASAIRDAGIVGQVERHGPAALGLEVPDQRRTADESLGPSRVNGGRSVTLGRVAADAGDRPVRQRGTSDGGEQRECESDGLHGVLPLLA